jgi:lipopolysaccharide transport protein LptA
LSCNTMSRASLRLKSFLAAALALLPLVGAAQNDQRAFMLHCAGPMAIDLQTNTSVCHDALISDGEIQISADEGSASETTFDEGEWQFSGNVRIAFGSATLRADQARFRFSANELVAGELSGSPVELEDFIADENVAVSGTAQRITYDNASGTARLEGEATLRRGTREFIGCDLVYNFKEKSMQSDSSACGVQMRVFPQDPPAEGQSEGS